VLQAEEPRAEELVVVVTPLLPRTEVVWYRYVQLVLPDEDVEACCSQLVELLPLPLPVGLVSFQLLPDA
jgi:hypothetical protein